MNRPGKVILICICLCYTVRHVVSQDSPHLPSLSLLRGEEDYSHLRGNELNGVPERLKFLPFSDKSYLSLGGEARYLAEVFHNNGWDKATGTTEWLLQRYMLHADWHLGNFRTFVQLHSAFQGLTDQSPRGVDRDDLDFHQLFLEYKIPLGSGQQLTTRVGRQEFWLGSRRLVSVREGPNVRLTFDAARIFYTRPGFRMDGIYALLVENEFGVFDNTYTSDEKFWGLYSVTDKLLGPFNADLYYLGFHSTLRAYDQGQAEETRHTLGARIWKGGPLKVNAELVYQWGNFGEGNINAYTFSLDISQKINLPLQPVFGIKGEIVSGDEDSDKADLQTFNAFYPRGAYFGLIALIGPANLMDVHPSLALSLTDNLVFTVDWDFFWRHRTTDGVYGPNKALERSGALSDERYIGHQPGFELAYERGRYWSFSLEGSYFVAGRFFADTGTGDNVLHFATSTRFKF